MTSGKMILASAVTFVVLLVTAAVWTFSNAGDCPSDMVCVRPSWIDPAIALVGIAVWLAVLVPIFRRKQR